MCFFQVTGITKLAIKLGKAGSIIGGLAGLIELSIGTKILPWIGNKESPFALGLVTLILSAVAFFSIVSASKQSVLTNNRKLAIFLGVLLPAIICFTTVGRLWYLPGSLLLFTSFLLAFEFWISQSKESSSSKGSRTVQLKQVIGVIGSLIILVSVSLAFFISNYGLFQSEILVDSNRTLIQVVPMDIVRLENLHTNENMIEEFEVGFVMFVYIFLILGASIALLSSMADSRLFIFIGGVIVLAGLFLFLLEMPGLLGQMGAASVKLLDLFRSFGLGWYISMSGVALIMIASLFQFQPRNVNS